MTVTSEVSRSGPYNGNGSTTVFPYEFKIFTAADLLVTEVDLDGIETTLVNGVDYTVNGVLSDDGGDVTLTTALAGDGTDAGSHKLTIRRVLDATQTMNLRSQGKISAEVLERAHDRAVMLIQQLLDERNRSLRLIESEAGSELLTLLPALADRKGRQLTFDPTTGQPTASSPTSAAVSAAMEDVVASATLDLAASAFAFAATGGTAARNQRDRAADTINVLEYEPDRTGAVDATAAMQAAINAATAGQTVYIPRGTYLTTGLTVSKQIRIVGDGAGTILRASGSTAQVFAVSAGDGTVISDMRLEGTKTDESGGDQFGIRVTGGSRGTIERVWFIGSSGVNGFNIQIHLQNVSYWTVNKCRFEQAIGTNSSYGYGCLVETCTGCSITDCVGIQSATQGRHHVYLSAGTSSSMVKGNRFFGGTQEMISIYATDAQEWCENNIVEGNLCTGTVLALNLGGVIGLLQKCRYNAIRGNTVRSNLLGNGILLQAGTGVSDSRCPFNVVEDNIVAENGRNGVKVAGAEDCIIRGNLVYDNSQSSNTTYVGIEVSPNGANAPCRRNKLLNNICTGTAMQRSPYRIADGSGVRPLDTVVRGNECPKGGFSYAQDSGDKTVVDETYVIKRRVTYADFSAAATTNYVILFSLGPGEKVESAILKHETAFSGGAIATYTLSVGIVGAYTKYSTALNALAAPGATTFVNADTTGIENMATGETNIVVLSTSGGANLNAATQGEANIWVCVRRHLMPVQ